MTTNSKHLVRVGHEFAAAMSDDTPIITIAKMVTNLASALDVQTARSEALAAENMVLIGFDADEFSYNGPYQPDDAVLEKLKTPATDAWVNEQRAVGVEMFVSDFTEPAVMNDGKFYSEDLIKASKDFAAQLRGSQV